MKFRRDIRAVMELFKASGSARACCVFQHRGQRSLRDAPKHFKYTQHGLTTYFSIELTLLWKSSINGTDNQFSFEKIIDEY